MNPEPEPMAAKVALADARSAGVQLCHHESTGSVDRVDIIRRRPRQLERDLHDGGQQSLLAVATTLSRASLAHGEGNLRTVVDDARVQLTRPWPSCDPWHAASTPRP